MKQPTFITGNQNKADYLQRLLGIDLSHKKIDLDEIQSLNLHEIVEHKVRQAYEIIKSPVIVEDVSLEFDALGGLPGPFIKFFVEDAGLDKICRMLDGFSDRSAVAKCTFGYFDGHTLKMIDGQLAGEISRDPIGSNGYGWDQVFIPVGYGGKTRAQLDDAQNDETYQIIKPFDELRQFLSSI